MSSENISLSYRDAGVDIDAGNALVDRIKAVSKKTRRPEVRGNLGGFAALCDIPSRYKNPVLVSGTDGVGTKLKLAMQLQQHDSIGIDLVAMCVNDLVVTGAEPLFFLDYYATGKLEVDVAASVVSGIGQGCEMAGCALIGGETAEMPGMYSAGDYDLAGFCVGVVENDEIIDGNDVKAGDVLLALGASGPHSNGYSLIRKVIEHCGAQLDQTFESKTLGETLLEPTRIYVRTLLNLQAQVRVKAMAHITGGGLPENLPRVLPENSRAIIDRSSWQRPAIFDWLQQNGNIAEQEMYRTFNCGVGMVLCVAAEDAQNALALLAESGEQAWRLGSIEASDSADRIIIE